MRDATEAAAAACAPGDSSHGRAGPASAGPASAGQASARPDGECPDAVAVLLRRLRDAAAAHDGELATVPSRGS